jgi:formylglycine-generating enzyme required for sulfatase activity
MNELALKPGAYAQIRVREPAGERTFGSTITIGGEGADIVVPGPSAGPALRLEWRDRQWFAQPEPGAAIRLNGRVLGAARDLRRGDVLTVGEAQIVTTDLTRTLLKVEVRHLVGNATIAPVGLVTSIGADAGDEDIEIRIVPPALSPRVGVTEPAAAPRVPLAERTRNYWPAAAVALVALAFFLFLIFSFEAVPLEVTPRDARISTPGTLLSTRFNDRLYLLPGEHVVRAEREGYESAQVSVRVGEPPNQPARLRLAKLPGQLAIDTGGVAVSVIVDGVEIGQTPGDIQVPAGRHTITLRAPKYLDYVTTMDIEGAGVRQELKAQLQPSWGTLKVAVDPPGATVSVDDAERGVAPLSIDMPSGVHRVKVSAPGLKTWESSVVVKAGETLSIGPITLGQPDARLTIRSRPSGAEVSVGGTFRGRTPLVVDLPAGIAYDVVATLPGHTDWRGSVFAEAGKQITHNIQLEPILARVTVQGEPAEAELFIDDEPRGQTPQTLDLTTVEHKIEVRKAGYLPFVGSVTPASGLERTLEYRLTPSDRGRALEVTAPTITTHTGYVLRLVPGGTFKMGSERREQGRRPNEGLRTVILKRPFYIGVREVTNKEFRQFRSGHASGFLDRRTIDLDDHPVSNVTWEDAAAFCNWLSEREGLPPAYEQSGKTFVLKRPVTTGYRLPTEAEWEYAARFVAPGQFRRFAWGDALPVPSNIGNIAGVEAENVLEATLEGYKDEYVVVAPAGKFRPTPLGLHDMSGNVSEWVNDYYLSYVDPATVTDPLGPEQAGRHVIRGANWKTASVAELRLAWRDSADAASQTIGFRMARYAE